MQTSGYLYNISEHIILYMGQGGSNNVNANGLNLTSSSSPPSQWHKPVNAKMVYFLCVGGGAGGACGTSVTTAAAAAGGIGGGNGATSSLLIPASLLPDSLAICVGQGGLGAPGVTNGTATTDGSNGTASVVAAPTFLGGGNLPASFFLVANGGNSAGGVTPAPSIVNCYLSGPGIFSGTAGSAGGSGGSSSAGTGTTSQSSAGTAISSAGAGGAGCAAAATHAGGSVTGAAGSPILNASSTTIAAGGASPGVSTIGNRGQDGYMLTTGLPNLYPFIGTGGAGGSDAVAQTAGNGGNGGLGSGGGGGGGANTTLSTYYSGAGGNGGPGCVLIVWW